MADNKEQQELAALIKEATKDWGEWSDEDVANLVLDAGYRKSVVDQPKKELTLVSNLLIMEGDPASKVQWIKGYNAGTKDQLAHDKE